MKKILLALSIASLLGLSVSCSEDREEQEMGTFGTETERVDETGLETDPGFEDSVNEEDSLSEQQEERYPVDDSGQVIDNTQPTSTEAIEDSEVAPALENE